MSDPIAIVTPESPAPPRIIEVQPVPRVRHVSITTTPQWSEKLSQLSHHSGMTQEEVAAAILENALSFRRAWMKFADPVPAKTKATTAQKRGHPKRRCRLAVPITTELDELLTEFSRLGGLSKGEIALMLMDFLPADAAVATAVAALRQLHAQRAADLLKPITIEPATTGTAAD